MQMCLQKKEPELWLCACSRERVGLEHWLNGYQYKILQGPGFQLSAQQSREK